MSEKKRGAARFFRCKFSSKKSGLGGPPPRGGVPPPSCTGPDRGGGQKNVFFTATISTSRPTVQARNPFSHDFVRGPPPEGVAVKKMQESPLGKGA